MRCILEESDPPSVHCALNLVNPPFLRPPKKLVLNAKSKTRLYREVNARNKSDVYENILFASYSFSTICYFRMIAVFEGVMRAMQSVWVRLFKRLSVHSVYIVVNEHQRDRDCTLRTELSNIKAP